MATRRLTRGERREQTREQLLEAAARVFARRGYHGAAVDEVAEEAGYTTGALYSNFSGKEDLFLSLLERFAARQLEEIAAAAASGPSAGARARAGADTWMAFLEREPELVPLFVEFWSYAVRNPELRPRFAEQRARARDIVCGVIEQAARDLGLRFRVPPDSSRRRSRRSPTGSRCSGSPTRSRCRTTSSARCWPRCSTALRACAALAQTAEVGVVLDVTEPVLAGDLARPVVEAAVAHLFGAAAFATDEVVVVAGAAQAERQLAGLAVQPVGDALVGQALELPVDRCQRNRGAVAAKGDEEVLRRDGGGGVLERLEDLGALAGGPGHRGKAYRER